MIILLTDGEPFPQNADPPHEPCITSTSYESSTLSELKALDTLILAVGIAMNDAEVSEYLACILEDFNEHYFEATDFDALASLVDDIGSVVCSDDIQLVINEVGSSAPTASTDNSASISPSNTPTEEPTSAFAITAVSGNVALYAFTAEHGIILVLVVAVSLCL